MALSLVHRHSAATSLLAVTTFFIFVFRDISSRYLLKSIKLVSYRYCLLVANITIVKTSHIVQLTSPGGNTPQGTNYTATYLPSRKLSKLDEPSRDELISDDLQWTPTYGQAKAGRPARTYIQQLCEDTGCSPEDLPEAMNDREKWRERVRDIRAGGTTWWWWWWTGCFLIQRRLKLIFTEKILWLKDTPSKKGYASQCKDATPRL